MAVIECLAESAQGVVVDRENGLIKNVCILSETSANGYKYPVSVMQGALPFYENKPAYFDHWNFKDRSKKPGQRTVRDWAAKILTPRMDGNRVRADLKVGKGHNGQQLMDIAEVSPDDIGMSSVADYEYDNRTKTALKCVKVYSVDVVAGPATTKTLQESVLENDLELKEKLSGILQGGGDALAVLKTLCEASEVTFDESKYTIPKLLSESEQSQLDADLAELAKFRKEKMASKVIAENGKNKVKATESVLALLSEQASEDAMVRMVKVLAESAVVPEVKTKSGEREAGTPLTKEELVKQLKGNK